MNAPVIRLTSLAHGGGCGCKLAPSVLQQLLAGSAFSSTPIANSWSAPKPATTPPCGSSTIEPASSPRPIFSCRWSTTRSISGASPPPTPSPTSTRWAADRSWLWPFSGCRSTKFRRRWCGKFSRAARKSAQAPESRSLAAIRSIRRSRSTASLLSVSAARRIFAATPECSPGDALILTKALGVGIYSAAFKKGALSSAAYAEMVASMTLLNRIGADLAKDPAVHAITDVTGFGLFGHALGMARGSHVALTARFHDLPFLFGGGRFGAAAFCHRRFGAELGELRRSVSLPSRLSRLAARFAHRPADLRRPVDRLRTRSCRGNYQHDYRQRLSAARIIGRADAGAPSITISS